VRLHLRAWFADRRLRRLVTEPVDAQAGVAQGAPAIPLPIRPDTATDPAADEGVA
jgi:hypothetical protein